MAYLRPLSRLMLEDSHVTNKQTAGRSGPNSTAHDGVKSEDGKTVMCGAGLGQQSRDGDMSTATYQGDMAEATYQGDMAEATYQGDMAKATYHRYTKEQEQRYKDWKDFLCLSDSDSS